MFVEATVGGEVLGDVFLRAGVGQQQRLHLFKAAFGLQGVGGEQVLCELFFFVVVHAVGVGFVQHAQFGFAEFLRGFAAHEVADVDESQRGGEGGDDAAEDKQ